jgi:DNA invertase Pin-like site-specific DNA recombinase
VSAVTAEDWNLPIALVGYGRCSTAEQAMDGVSIEVQRRAVQSLADRKGWDMAWLADEGVSGAVSPEERKRFKAALAFWRLVSERR